MTNTRTIYIVDGTGFLAPGLDDEARVAKRARHMLSNITEPCEENVVKHHLAAPIFASQNDDLTRIETHEHLFDRKLLDIMPEGGSYEVVELRTQFVPGGNRHVSPTIGFSRVEFGACRMLDKRIPQDQLLAFLDTHEPYHDLMVIVHDAINKAVIKRADGETYRKLATEKVEADPSERNRLRLEAIERRLPSPEEAPGAFHLGGMR